MLSVGRSKNISDRSDRFLEKTVIIWEAILEEAKGLWQDFNRVEISAKSVDEPRFMIISKFQEKHWSAIITYRNETIRIISVRRSKESEIKLYES